MLESLKRVALEFLPLTGVLCFSFLVWWGYSAALRKREPIARPGTRYRSQILLVCLVVITVVCSILALPVPDATQRNLFNVIGLMITVMVTLSSTTFMANVMSSLMLRMVKNFRIGDFIEVGEHFGRVTERGLFHTEIQTPDSNLTTLPNLHLVTNPVKVTRYTGTLVSASVSLGYDIPTTKVEACLLYAAKKAQLDNAFVHIMELGDYSITYKVAAFLEDIKGLLTAQSNLKRMAIDCLHGAGIEIVSPTFMVQRRLDPSQTVIPDPDARRTGSLADTVEDKVFNKADDAVKLDTLHHEEDALVVEINDLRKAMNATTNPHEKVTYSGKIAKLERRLQHLSERKQRTAEDLSKNDVE